MPRGELVAVRVTDLEPGQRVCMPRMSRTRLQTVVSVHTDDEGSVILNTDLGAYVCGRTDLVDVEDCWRGVAVSVTKDDTIPPTMRAVREPPRPAARRTLTPPTLRTADVHRLDVVLERLRFALRASETVGQLRTYLVELAADVEAVCAGDKAAPTLRVSDVAPDTLPAESAPSTDHGSDQAEEFGPGGSLWYAAR